jgi:hypothetical protein
VTLTLKCLALKTKSRDFSTRTINQHKNIIKNAPILAIFEYNTNLSDAINLKERAIEFEYEFA